MMALFRDYMNAIGEEDLDTAHAVETRMSGILDALERWQQVKPTFEHQFRTRKVPVR